MSLVDAHSNYEYSFATPRRQYFTFPYISYITEHPTSSALGYRKLQQTCKYFFSKKKIIVVDVHVFSDSGIIYFPINVHKPEEYYKSKNNFVYWPCKAFTLNLEASSECLNQIYRFTLKKLIIHHQNLNFIEICRLLNDKKMEDLVLYNVNIKHENNGTPVTLDQILSKCPNIQKLVYSNLCEIYSNQTFEKLNQLKFNQKFRICNWVISQIMGGIDAKIFCEFLKKNVVLSAKPYIRFEGGSSNNELKLFKEEVQKILRGQQQRPND